MKRKQKTFKEDIRRTLIVYALAPAMLLTAIGLIASAVIFYRSIINYNAQVNLQMSHQLSETSENYLDFANRFATDEMVIRYMKNPRSTAEVAAQLYDYVRSQALKGEFYLINVDNDMLIGSTREMPDYLIKGHHNQFGILFKLMSQRQTSQVAIDTNKDFQKAITFGKAIIEDDQYLGAIVFVLPGQSLADYFKEVDSLNWMVTDRNGYVIWSTEPLLVDRLGRIFNELQGNSGFISTLGTNFYTKTARIVNNQLEVHTISHFGTYTNIFMSVIITLVIIFILVFVLLYVVSAWIAKSKTKVIDQIVETMSYMRTGHFDRPMVIHSEDEFQQIATSYNKMLFKMDELMHDNQELGRQNVISELKQLESQFDPHFIFNTLELIKYMIKIDSKGASKALVGMSTLLRSSLDNTASTITLEADIEYTKNYLMIQKYRFGEQLSYEFNVDENTLECIVPKRIIQPIVENSLIYGIEYQTDFLIKVDAYVEDNQLMLVVRDNGKGIDRLKIDEIEHILKQKVNTSLHNGLYNVHRRIGLIYGIEYGLKIKGLENQGTEVIITLPVKKELI